MNDAIQSSFDALYLANYKFLFTLAYRLTQNYHDAEDLVEEAFIVYLVKSEDTHIENPRAYMVGILSKLYGTTYVLKSAPHFHPTRYQKSPHLQMMSPILSRMFFRQNYYRGSGKFSFCGIPLVCPLPKSLSGSISKNPVAVRGTCGQRLI